MSDLPMVVAFPEAHLLIADDDREVRSILVRFFRLLGYRADGAASGPQALAMVARTTYDVAVVDIRMPGMDGVELMRQLRQKSPELAIILLTGHGSLESAIAAVREHVTDYLLKPVSNREIAAAVAKALEERVRSVNRGQVRDEPAERYVQAGPLTLDRERRVVVLSSPSGDVRAQLTPSEAALLAYLMEHRGRAVATQELAQAALGYEVSGVEAPELVRPHIARLRKKLEPGPEHLRLVRTVAGVGYVFAP